jgi:hypothetical protein
MPITGGEKIMDPMRAILQTRDVLDALGEGEALLFKHSPT